MNIHYYYSGDINGIFCPNIQSSYDAEYFCVKHKKVFCFDICDCYCDELMTISNKIYCKKCFSSYEEHMYSIKQLNKDALDTIYVSESDIEFNFFDNDLDKVKEKIDFLEDLVGKYMNNYDVELEKQELVARLYLGRLIYYCLKKNGRCFFKAEV